MLFKNTQEREELLKEIRSMPSLDDDVISNTTTKIPGKVSSYEEACKLTGTQQLTLADFYLFSKQESITNYAFHKLSTIIKAVNKGWYPDFTNSKEYKWYPWFKHASAGSGLVVDAVAYGDIHCHLPGCLYYQNESDAKYYSEYFLSLYNEYLL